MDEIVSRQHWIKSTDGVGRIARKPREFGNAFELIDQKLPLYV